jgi:hypothetical protein
MILEHVERWPTRGIEGDDLAVDHGFVRELLQRLCDQIKAISEIPSVAREQLNLTVRLRAQGTIAVEFELVRPRRFSGNFATGRLNIGSTNPTLVFTFFSDRSLSLLAK